MGKIIPGIPKTMERAISFWRHGYSELFEFQFDFFRVINIAEIAFLDILIKFGRRVGSDTDSRYFKNWF